MEPINTCDKNKSGKRRGSIFGAVTGILATVPNWTAAGILALLGLAGSTAAVIASWLSPVFIAVSVILLGRAHYVAHVLKQGNRTSLIITWLATFFVIGFWIWQWGFK